jgi:prephenate dehydrogenase
LIRLVGRPTNYWLVIQPNPRVRVKPTTRREFANIGGMRVGIVGLGLMGGSLALALRAAQPALEVMGRDVDPGTMRHALEAGMVCEGDPGTADLLVLAAPIQTLPQLLAGLSGRRGPVTDMASTKVEVMGWAASAGVDLVGGHPMCGSERSGIEAADPALFRGAPWVLTRDEPAVTDLVRAVGAVPVFLSAEQHDHLVAGVSHAAFAVSAAYVLALAGDDDWPAMLQVAGSGFRDVSRLAGGDPGLYAAIVATNRRPLAEALRSIERELAGLRSLVESPDQEQRLLDLFQRAKRDRDAWTAR